MVKAEFIFFHSISYLETIFFPKIHKVVFSLGRTAQNHLKVSAYRFLGHADCSGGG